MCEICGRTPCHPRCPNAEDIIIGVCAQCQADLCEGDRVWQDADGNLFCDRDCALEYYGIEELD